MIAYIIGSSLSAVRKPLMLFLILVFQRGGFPSLLMFQRGGYEGGATLELLCGVRGGCGHAELRGGATPSCLRPYDAGFGNHIVVCCAAPAVLLPLTSRGHGELLPLRNCSCC